MKTRQHYIPELKLSIVLPANLTAGEVRTRIEDFKRRYAESRPVVWNDTKPNKYEDSIYV